MPRRAGGTKQPSALFYHRDAMTTVSTNLWKIFLYKFLSEFYLIAPILIPYYVSHDLSSTQVFTVQGTYALAILLLEVPSGYLADVWGRKMTLVLGASVFPLGLCIYVWGNSFWFFVLAELILAAANSMRSGCDSALIYDTLLELGQQDTYKKYEGRAFFYTRIGSSGSAVLGGLLALLSLNLPFYINIITGAAMLPLALSIREPKRGKPAAGNPFLEILKICRSCFRHPRLRFLILYTGLILSTGITGIWAYFLYYESLGISVGYFGILFAVFHLASALGSHKAHVIEKKVGKKPALFLFLLIAPIFILLGVIQSIYLIPLILMNAFIWGLSFPVLMSHMNLLIGSEIRATVLSVAQMTGSLSFVLLAPIFGGLTDRFSLSAAFIVLGGYFFLYGSSMALLLTGKLAANAEPIHTDRQ